MMTEKYRKKHNIPEDSLLAIGVDGYMAFDGQYVTIQRVGVLGRLGVGKGVKRIPVKAISSMQLKPAGSVISGYLQLSIAGGNEVRSQFGKQTFNAAQDENSMLFVKKEEPDFHVLRDAVEQAQQQGDQVVSVQAPDVLTQLETLGKLRDAGVITETEFESKKIDLLGRL